MRRRSEKRNQEVSSLVFFRTTKDFVGVVHEKIPKYSSICTSSSFAVDNASPRSGNLHTSYPANSATTDIVALNNQWLLFIKTTGFKSEKGVKQNEKTS